jgi:hypothetical protein
MGNVEEDVRTIQVSYTPPERKCKQVKKGLR